MVKNIGTEPATEIKMMASKNLPVDPKLKDIVTDFLDQEIAFLEPGGVRRTFIGSFPILIELQNEDALVTITTKETGSSTYPINVHSFTATVKDSTNIEMSLSFNHIAYKCLSSTRLAASSSDSFLCFPLCTIARAYK